MADPRGARRSGPGRSRRLITMLLTIAAATVAAAIPPAAAAAAAGGGAGLDATTTPAHAAHHGHHRRRAKRHRRRHRRRTKAHHRHHRQRRHHPQPSHHRRARAHRHRINPLHTRAMWIWELDHTDGGDLPQIIAGAQYYRVRTLIIKSSDGTDLWSQFTPALVAELHAAHLKVCAWQYVYGRRAGVEANLGADAVKDGADCLVIDAESEYEGKYVAAESYVHDLRKQIGRRYPVALADFPYADYHPAFPYSVFLGPGGAQSDMPQMYWRDIGQSPARVFAHTYAYNLPYRRRIYPLGQVYGRPPQRQIIRFRRLTISYGAPGISWWDWQTAGAPEWDALSVATGPVASAETVAPVMGTVAKGARGDLVVWIQEHLVSAGYPSAIDGAFGRHTRRAVEAFQSAHGLVADGVVGPATWQALLRYRPVAVHWVHSGRHIIATDAVRSDVAGPGGRAPAVPAASAPTGGAALTLPVPVSASAPARRDEIPGSLGAGGPP